MRVPPRDEARATGGMEVRVLRKLAVWTLLLGGIALLSAAHLGAFTRIHVVERDAGGIRFVYLPVEGANFFTVRSVSEEVGYALNVAGATRIEAIGVYHPPGSGKPNEIGFAVDETEHDALPQLDPKYLQREIPRTLSMVVMFPYENPLSYVMGFLRVDPLLAAHRAEHGYREALAYTIDGEDRILYVQPIER
jgi:hypothetical protein